MEDYKIIFHLVKPYWKRVALAGIVSIFVSGLNASLAWLAKPAMDGVLLKENLSMLVYLPFGVFAIFTVKGGFVFLHEYLMRSAAQKMVMNLRNRLYQHILKLPMGYFNKNSSGTMISKVVNDTVATQIVVSLAIKDLLVESASFIALTGVALYRRWDLTLIAIVGLPIAFYGVGRLGKRIKQISKRTQEKIAVITETLNESFTGIKMIKAFCQETNETKYFEDKSKDYYRENMRSVRVSQLAKLLMEVMAGFGIAFVMWYGGKLIVENAMTPGDFFSFLAAIFMLYTPARRLAGVNNGIQKARAPLQRIFSLLSEEKEKDGINNIDSFKSEIKLDQVALTYPSTKKKALDNISLTIKKGMIIAIVGQSGAGKTSLVNMLPGFYRPDVGSIQIDGTDISSSTLTSLRSLFGIVSQEVILFNDTVFNNIKYGKPDASFEEVTSASKAAYAHDFIMEFADTYNSIVGEKGVKLSGGQKQRLSIARAVLKNPPILILDEATSSLDTESEMKIQNALESLMKGRTTLVIAHRLSTVRKADMIITMERGKIVESGTHEELFARKGLYHKLYDLQFRDQEEVLQK